MIYFIENPRSKAIKIGKADDGHQRFRQLQTASPEPLNMVGLVPGDLAEESAWHDRWRHLRVRGEWFRTDPELVEAIGLTIAARGLHPDPPRWIAEFEDIVRLVPDLGAMAREAASYRAAAILDDHFCANAVWYGYDGFPGIKGRLVFLVGFHRAISDPHPELRECRAYDTAYQAIYQALPDCKDECTCQAFLAAALGA